MRELGGKVVVVTGAASGIGFAMAEAFARRGARLVVADIERRALEEAAARLRGNGVDILAIPTDVADPASVDALAAATVERHGAVHVVCNNAGVGSRGLPIAELPLSDFEWVLGVNLFGVVHGIHAFLPWLRTQDEGHLVNTASVAGLVHLANMGPYNAAKAAVVALSETLRFELAEEGSHVGVSVLCPGWVRTNLGTSDRNRPERFAVTLSQDQAARVDARRQQIAEVFARDAIDPAEVGEQVARAVEEDRFYVLTHPDMTAEVVRRVERLAAGAPPEPPRI